MGHSTSTPTTNHRSRSVIGALALTIGVSLTAFGLTGGASLAFTGPDELPSTAASNEAAYWGEGCWKLDEPGGLSWVADADYSKVVLKAAQTDFVFYDVEKDDVLTVDQNAISHFIFCPPAATTTTTTTIVEEETTTTTVVEEETTTTVVKEETTTTVVEESPTTTLAEEEPTTTLAAQAGPTTTQTASAGATTTPLAVELPSTGVDTTTSLAVIGALLTAAGLTLLSLSRRRTTA